jgi:hypothetical protein
MKDKMKVYLLHLVRIEMAYESEICDRTRKLMMLNHETGDLRAWING